MRTTLVVLGIMVLAALASACNYYSPTVITGSGNVVSEPRTVSGFSAVTLSGSGTLMVAQGDIESLTIEGEDNLIAQIETRVEQDRLIIGVKGNNVVLNPMKPLVYHLAAKQLDALNLSGAGNMQADAISAPSFALDISGAGNASIKTLTADSVRVNLNGAGSATLGGRTTQQTITVSGVGSYSGEGLASEQASATTSGTGAIALRASRTLDAHISGAGVIRYWGSPQVTQSISGIGTVSRQGE